MDHYIDIRVLPDPEFKETTLMNALYAKLHRVLHKTTEGRVGVSFPHFNKNLGDILRLHGTHQDLALLIDQPWLQGLKDYCNASDILTVPTDPQYRVVRRKQIKSQHNKRARSINKGWLSEQQALEQIPDEAQKPVKLPYAQIKSLSNGNVMRIYVEHQPLLTIPTPGLFSSYGLSTTATVPWF
ncbi:MAG: type I-F CRISPR-associated endoribonuclease Cas6/Csy4 [Porticoccaceae bacterium]|nr:type I-F CRISPR-associated endoribonuclease Cas6/Csy4 [Porticoccaceae bacterium]